MTAADPVAQGMTAKLGPVLICVERGDWWFRVFGYGLHYRNTRHHRPLFSMRHRTGSHRFDLHLGRFIIGPLWPRGRGRGNA